MNMYSERIKQQLISLYGSEIGAATASQLTKRLEEFLADQPATPRPSSALADHLSERDAILITYGDQFREIEVPPLASLHKFLVNHLKGVLNAVHILPFYPYSSDDGFSVIDYREVDPALGTWENISDLSRDFRLMFDAVINHLSQESSWFQGFLAGQQPYDQYFHTVDPQTDLTGVFRPRALPLLTRFDTEAGPQHVWTTFSDDQIDLNFANPEVLLDVLDVLLLYLKYGASLIRLDAIAYLWKEIGTSCIHLPQTHLVVKLIRTVFEAVAPGTIIITETNVPHEENISYFGEYDAQLGTNDEAQMVYQFPLGPLVLHSLSAGNAEKLSKWAANLETKSKNTTFFNFIASHDGIGLMPARGLLTTEEIQQLVDQAVDHGGKLGLKTNSDGSQSVYELNITLFDALNDPQSPDNTLDIARFIASQGIMISLAGVPGIYVHSLFGSRNCLECLARTGRSRSINREKFDLLPFEEELSNPDSLRIQVFNEYKKILEIRASHPAFHPLGPQRVLHQTPEVFALLRTSIDGTESILCVINVTRNQKEISIDTKVHNLPETNHWIDLIANSVHEINLQNSQSHLKLSLGPYQISWLKPSNS
jgi:sucrose phosphorylase